MIPRRLWFGLVLGALGWAEPMAAQDPRLAGHLSGPALESVQSIVDSARALALPSEPLVQKALEGAAKGASPDRIVTALQHLLADLVASRSALGAAASDNDLVAGASALRAGARAQDLRALTGARAGQHLTVPLAVLSDLVSRGVSGDTAAAVVVALAIRGAPDAEFNALERDVTRDIQAGAPPAAAASLRARHGPPQGVPRHPPVEHPPHPSHP